MRIGAAAAPRWWGMDPRRLPGYLEHLVACGARSVELIVHHGPASRDPTTVHLDRDEWVPSVRAAQRLGLHVDVHNSLDPRFGLDRWDVDRAGLTGDLQPILGLLAEVGAGQPDPPAFVVHAAASVPAPGETTTAALEWMVDGLRRLGSAAVVCVELRSAAGPDDERLDRDAGRLNEFVRSLGESSVAMCWDVANGWLNSRRAGRDPLPGTLPGSVRHVHLHDATPDGGLHAPLGEGGVPWSPALDLIRSAGYNGSVTLEIRYRLACDVGDPRAVLAESIHRSLRGR